MTIWAWNPDFRYLCRRNKAVSNLHTSAGGLAPTHSYELYYKIDCVNKQYYRWMNTHVETFSDIWMANIVLIDQLLRAW